MAEPILPAITDLNRPFWEGAAAGVLRLQRCAGCGHVRYPISAHCPVCLASEATWEPMSGRGTALSYTRFHRAYHPAWEERVPYVVVLVQLDEGPRLFSTLAGGDALEVDDPVEFVFVPDASGSVTLPLVRRALAGPR